MILEVLWHSLAGVKTSLQFGMGNVASHDNGSLKVYACADWIFCQFGKHGVDTLVEVNLNALCSLTRFAQFLRNKLCWAVVHLLQPYSILVNLCLYVAVGRAANSHTYRTACAMAWQTYNTNVVSKVFSTKLCAKTYLVCFLQQFLLKVDVAESTACLVACCRQVVVVFY